MAQEAGTSPYTNLPQAVPYGGIEYYDQPEPNYQKNYYAFPSQQPDSSQQAVPNSPVPSYPLPQYSEMSGGQGPKPVNTEPKLATTVVEDQTTSEKTPWWRRHLLLLCIAALVIIGAAVGGGVGGAIAAKKKKSNTVVEGTVADANENVSSIPSSVVVARTSSGAVQTVTAGQSTPEPTIIIATSVVFVTPTPEPTPTPSPTPTPTPTPTPVSSAEPVVTPHQIVLGKRTISGTQNEYAWLWGVVDNQCNGFPIQWSNRVLCEVSFTLVDGITYWWEGCGGDTYLSWQSGSQSGRMGGCVSLAEKWDCGGEEVEGQWLCG